MKSFTVDVEPIVQWLKNNRNQLIHNIVFGVAGNGYSERELREIANLMITWCEQSIDCGEFIDIPTEAFSVVPVGIHLSAFQFVKEQLLQQAFNHSWKESFVLKTHLNGFQQMLLKVEAENVVQMHAQLIS
jgi:hypothetical protein